VALQNGRKMAGQLARTRNNGDANLLAVTLLRRLTSPLELVVRHPVFLLLALRFGEVLRCWWARRQKWLLDRSRVLRTPLGVSEEAFSGLDSEIVQGCFLSAENLLNLGRIEKRTLFVHRLIDVLGGNRHLAQELLTAARVCRAKGQNCLVTRFMQPDERYHVLQASVNATSSLFGANYVHFNAMKGEDSGLFKSTWYCVTVMCSTWSPESVSPAVEGASEGVSAPSCSNPRATLRVVCTNESEVRRIADGKLCAPSWGLFNSRHASRYRMLLDFARSFQIQLHRAAPGDPSELQGSMSSHHGAKSLGGLSRRDGGQIKRIQSESSLAGLAGLGGGSAPYCGQASASSGHMGGMRRGDGGQIKRIQSGNLAALVAHGSAPRGLPLPAEALGTGAADFGTSPGGMKSHAVTAVDALSLKQQDGAMEENCFLRLQVPHYMGPGGGPEFLSV